MKEEDEEITSHIAERAEVARLTAERDAAIQRMREYEHYVMTGREQQFERLTAELDAARAEHAARCERQDGDPTVQDLRWTIENYDVSHMIGRRAARALLRAWGEAE